MASNADVGTSSLRDASSLVDPCTEAQPEPPEPGHGDVEQPDTLRVASAPCSTEAGQAQPIIEKLVRTVSEPLPEKLQEPLSDKLCREISPQQQSLTQRAISGRSWLAEVTRNVTTLLDSTAGNVVPTQRCSVCLENIPTADCISLKACGREAHGTCLECLKTYLKMRIEDARVADLRCPAAGTDGCEACVSEEELEEWLEVEVVEKYKRFRLMQGDTKLRACPQCNELCSPLARDPEEGIAGIIPEMTCQACSNVFCYYHSNAHGIGAKACAEYEREMIKEEKKALVKSSARRCPNCSVLTQKASGCNHMTCQCKTEWCWVCGEVITNVGWHYNPLKPLSCEQFVEEATQRGRQKALMYLTKLLVWPSSVITLCFVICAVLVFMCSQPLQVVIQCCNPCCWFRFYRCSEAKRTEACVNEWSVVSCTLTFILVGLPLCCFCISWAVAVLPLWLLLIPCGADCGHLKVMASVPFMTVMALLECVPRQDDHALSDVD